MPSGQADRGLSLLWILMLCLGMVFQSSQAWSQKAPNRSPREIVERWLQVYPEDMREAAELTTSSFRQGASREQWIATREPYLKNLGLKYIRAKVVHEERVGPEAHVIVHAHIVTRMGDQPQDERYILISNPDGGWLIDQVEVYTETFNRVP